MWGGREGGVDERFARDQATQLSEGGGCVGSVAGQARTLNTNMDVVLLTLLDLAGIFIRFRERVESFEILD
jgi:hypothetical protein